MKRIGGTLLALAGIGTLACGVPSEEFVTELDERVEDPVFPDRMEIDGPVLADTDLGTIDAPVQIGQGRSARDIIGMGFIPTVEDFALNAVLRDYELPISARCTDDVCVGTAAAIAPDAAGVMRGWVQVAFGSQANNGVYVRPATTYVMVVNTSDDMRWGVENSPGEMTRELMTQMVGRMTEDDRVSIITHGARTNVELDFAKGDDARITNLINDLTGAGALSGDDAVDLAYEIAAEADTENVRVLLFTNTRPSLDAFAPRMTRAAIDGVGTSFFEMGIDFGLQFETEIDQVPGANVFSIIEPSDIDLVMGDRFNALADPIAHEVRALLGVARDGIDLGRILGMQRAAGRQLGADIPNLFPGQAHRTFLVEIIGDVKEGIRLEGELSFSVPGGDRVTSQVSVNHVFQGQSAQFEQTGVARAAILAAWADGSREAVELYRDGQVRAATSLMERVAERFVADAFAVNDEALMAETTTALSLVELMRAGAPVL